MCSPSRIAVLIAGSLVGCSDGFHADPPDPYADLPHPQLLEPAAALSSDMGSDPWLAAGDGAWGLAYAPPTFAQIGGEGTVGYGPQSVAMGGIEPHIRAAMSGDGFGIEWLGLDGQILFKTASSTSVGATKVVSHTNEPSIPYADLAATPGGWLVAGCVEWNLNGGTRLVAAALDVSGAATGATDIPMPDRTYCGEVAVAALGAVTWLAYTTASGGLELQRLEGTAAAGEPVLLPTTGGASSPHLLGADHTFVLVYAGGSSFESLSWQAGQLPGATRGAVPLANHAGGQAAFTLLDDGLAVAWGPDGADGLVVQAFGLDGSARTAPTMVKPGWVAHAYPAIARLGEVVGVAFRNSDEPEEIWFARVGGL